MAGEFRKNIDIASEVKSNAIDGAVDISKRIDVNKEKSESGNEGVDISKRIIPEKAGNELNSNQIAELKSKGMSPGIIKDCICKDEVIMVKAQNEKLENQKHPECGVKFERKTVDLSGTKIEGVFPKFEAKFTAQLPTEKLRANDHEQFKECNQQLKEAVNNNPELKKQFSARQLDQIADGKQPGGYTWHHNEQVGKMELVNTEQHSAANHLGGKAIWGGGSDNR